VVLTVDEERAQTRTIHELQRRAHTLEGLLRRQERAAVIRLHQNAQRLLRPLLVVNPYADRLTFLDTKLRTRRDHVKYLTLIRAIALLFQHQRPVREALHAGRSVAYIEATLDDVRLANRLAAEILGRSLDELSPPTRRLLVLLDRFVGERSADRASFRFSRRELREECGWGHSQLAVHLERLVELEYVAVHRGGRGQSFVYELLYDGSGRQGERFLIGLIDPEQLDPAAAGEFPGSFRPASGPVPGGFRVAETATEASQTAAESKTRESGAGRHIGETPTENPIAQGVPA